MDYQGSTVVNEYARERVPNWLIGFIVVIAIGFLVLVVVTIANNM